MSHLPGKFVWFEYASSDTAKASAFYKSLFGWNVEQMPIGDQQYSMIMSSSQGIGGFTTAQPGMANRWVSYLSVLDVDKSYAAATKAGAKPLSPPMDYGPIGRGAAISDPTGAAVSLWKGAQEPRPDVDQTPVGDWFWNELWTADPTKALAFYESVFGYSHDSMDMGPMGTYYVLKSKDGKSRGGLMKQTEAPPQWCPYVHVADCDASAAKAKQLGAQTIVVPPTDIPDIGRFSVLVDPLGAMVAIIRGAAG